MAIASTTPTGTNNNLYDEPTAIVERQDNKLYFTGRINEVSAYRFLYLLHEIEKSKRDYVDKTCTLYLTSTGGECSSGLLMYDALRSSSLDITVITSGFIASAATIVMLASDKRKCTSNTNFLVHSIWSNVYGALPYVKSNLSYSEMLEQQFVDIYSKHTKITKDMMQQETFLSAKQALDLQLVTEVL